VKMVAEMAGLTVKPGLLWTDSAGIEESASFEFWSKGVWSADVIGTESVGGVGVVRDFGVVDVGIYGVSPWDEWNPEVGVGVGLSF